MLIQARRRSILVLGPWSLVLGLGPWSWSSTYHHHIIIISSSYHHHIIIISSSYHHIIIGIIISIILCRKKILGTQDGNKKKNYHLGRCPGGGLENQNPARTIAHSPPGVKETLNYMLREKRRDKSNRWATFLFLIP